MNYVVGILSKCDQVTIYCDNYAIYHVLLSIILSIFSI